MSDLLVFNLSVYLPLVLSAAASFNRCLAQRKSPWMFVDGPLYGSIVAASVFAAFATFMWCFPTGGQGPIGMGAPGVTTWSIITGVFTVLGACIGLFAATTVLIARHLRFQAVRPSRLP